MPDTQEFFSKILPEKVASKPELVEAVKSTIQFNITGAGIWTLDLKNAPGGVAEGPGENPGCIITVSKEDWEKLLATPSLGMQLFMTGKLKASNVGVAMQLQKILA